jgi:hypothetical protein
VEVLLLPLLFTVQSSAGETPNPVTAVQSRGISSIAALPAVVITEIPVAVVITVVLIVAAPIIVVPYWSEYTTSERRGEDRKNENVFHGGFSLENNPMDQVSARSPERCSGRTGAHRLLEHPQTALVCAPSYIAGDRTASNRSAKRGRLVVSGLEQREVRQRTDRVAEECLNMFYVRTPKSADN